MDNTIQIPENFNKRILTQFQDVEEVTQLHQEFKDIVSQYNLLGAGSNLLSQNTWIYYVHYCSLLNELIQNKNSLIIDWGGLFGHITMLLHTMGLKNTYNYLLDVSSNYAYFKDHFNIPTKLGTDPNQLALEDNSVDVFLSSGVLEHVMEDGVGDQDKIVNEIYRCIKPGGVFVIWNLPTYLGTSELVAILFKKLRHQFRFTNKDVKNMYAKTDFKLLYQDKMKFLPGSVMEKFMGSGNDVRNVQRDFTLSHIFPFSVFARDHLIVLQKPS